MAKKRRRKSTRPEILHPETPSSAPPSDVPFGVKGENDPEPEIECRPWLELRGELMEPIRDTFDVVFKLWPADFAPAHFDYFWSFALSGHLTHAFMVLTKPHYGSASVLT